jgi:hypothetical protein
MSSIKRSTFYLKELAKKAQISRYLETMVEEEVNREKWEKDNKQIIEKSYTMIENAAKTGAIRMFKKKDNSFVFENAELKSYLLRNGFQFTYNTIEWWDEEKELK